MVYPWGSRGTLHMEIGDRSRCLCCRELPSQFPGHFAGAERGDPNRNHAEDNPDSAEHVDWSLLTFSQAAEEPWLCDRDLRE